MANHDMEIRHPLEMEHLSYGHPRYFGQIDHCSSVGSCDCQFGGIKKGTWFLLGQAPTHQHYYSRGRYPLASGGGSPLLTFKMVVVLLLILVN